MKDEFVINYYQNILNLYDFFRCSRNNKNNDLRLIIYYVLIAFLPIKAAFSH